jgi:hypothetical protein
MTHHDRYVAVKHALVCSTKINSPILQLVLSPMGRLSVLAEQG